MTDTTPAETKAPLYQSAHHLDKKVHIATVLSDLASQENCDGEPYNAMQFAADYIRQLEGRSQAPLPESVTEALSYLRPDGYDPNGDLCVETLRAHMAALAASVAWHEELNVRTIESSQKRCDKLLVEIERLRGALHDIAVISQIDRKCPPPGSMIIYPEEAAKIRLICREALAPKQCKTCEGTGEDTTDPYVSFLPPCPDCNGTGKQKLRKCSRCKVILLLEHEVSECVNCRGTAGK